MRKKRVYRKHYSPDSVHQRVDIGRFINALMTAGKKTVAERIFYRALDIIKEKTGGSDPLSIFDKAIENVSPTVELAGRRVGGANYQIPIEVRPDRRFILSVRWLLTASRAKKGMPIASRLAEELIAAAGGEGAAIKKRTDTHKMAEANRAFAHFARFNKKKKKIGV